MDLLSLEDKRVRPGDLEASATWSTFAVPVAVFGVVLMSVNAVILRILGFGGSYYDQHRILQLLLMIGVTVGLALISRWRSLVVTSWRSLSTSTRGAVGTLFLLGTLSSFSSAVPAAAFRELSLFLMLVIVALLVAGARRVLGTAFDRAALTVVVIMALLYVLVFFALEPFVERDSHMYGFSNFRFFGKMGLLTLPLLIAAAVRFEERQAARAVLWSVAIMWWALILESGSRAGALGTLLGFGLTAILLRHRVRRWTGAMAGVLVAGAGVWVLVFRLLGLSTTDRLGADRMLAAGVSSSGRLRIWQHLWEIFLGNPVLGVGPEHYAYYSRSPVAGPHSSVMQFLAEWGLLATVIVIALAASATVAWFRARSVERLPPAEPGLVGALSVILVGTGAASTIEGFLAPALDQLLIAAIAGWMLGLHHNQSSRTKSRSGSRIGVAVLPIFATAILVTTALPYALRPQAELERFVLEHPQAAIAPRFWAIGWLNLEPLRTELIRPDGYVPE